MQTIVIQKPPVVTGFFTGEIKAYKAKAEPSDFNWDICEWMNVFSDWIIAETDEDYCYIYGILPDYGILNVRLQSDNSGDATVDRINFGIFSTNIQVNNKEESQEESTGTYIQKGQLVPARIGPSMLEIGSGEFVKMEGPEEIHFKIQAIENSDKISLWEYDETTGVYLKKSFPYTYSCMPSPGNPFTSKTLYLKGEQTSNTDKDIILILTGQANPDNISTDTAIITVFDIDLDWEGLSEDAEEETGIYIPLNVDDDNSDTTIDYQQNPVIGENDLKYLTLFCTPSNLPNIFTLSWGSNVKLWETASKETEITKTTYQATELPKTYYVEGYSVSSSLKDTEIKLSHTFPDGTTGEDKAKITVYEVEETTWEQINSVLDNNPNIGGGQRIFPCKQTPDDTTPRNQVYVKAKVKPVIPAIMVYFKSFDVDDPSSNSSPIDDEGLEKDNRGTPQEGSLEYTQQITDEEGIAKVKFTVTMQPGDNFRVIASGNNDFYKRFKVKQDDTTGKLIDGNNNEIPTNNTTPMLTVWRTLHIEVDSMEEVPTTGPERNFIDGYIVKITGDSTKATVVYVENCSPQAIDDGSAYLPTGNGRFEKGEIIIGSDHIETANLDGNGKSAVVKGSGINVPFTITKGSVTKSGKVKSMNDIGDKIFLFDTTITETDFAGGTLTVTGQSFLVDYSGGDTCVVNTTPTLSFKVWDDDQITGDVPMPDTSDLERVFNPAYVLPVFDVGDSNDNVEFKLNIAYGDSGYYNKDWNSKIYNKSDFWVAYILGAYQGDCWVEYTDDEWAGDNDPEKETAFLGLASSKGGCLIFMESCLDVSASISGVVDHEVSHFFGSIDASGQPMEDGRYTPETINYIRSSSKPYGN